MPATEINDLHSADVCLSTVFPQVRFAHPRPRKTRELTSAICFRYNR